MKLAYRLTAIASLIAGALLTTSSLAQTVKPFRIGALVDMSGIYSAHGGPGMITAVNMAIEDFGG